jgi:hypothetical protein
MADIVEATPMWCEQMGHAPGVADEGRGESMVHDMKLSSPNSRTMINHLPDMYEALVKHRNEWLQKQKTRVLPHELADAADEILAPCMIARNSHLGDNWDAFQARWSPRHAVFWRQHGGAHKFCVSMPCDRRPVHVHCQCGDLKHYALQFVDDWQPCA